MSRVAVTDSYLFSSSPLLTVSIPSLHPNNYSFRKPPPPDHQTRSIWCGGCGLRKEFVMNCGSRVCEYCREKSIRKTLNKKGLINKPPRDLRFMTLTLKSLQSLDPLTIVKVRDYFRHLIRRKLWKKYVHGGLYVIEVTKTNNGYHYHFHVIFQGQYFPHGELMKLWKDVTGGSYIVHLSRIYDTEKSFSYVLSYVSKVEKGNIDSNEYAETFKGIKLVQFFGYWCKLKSPKIPVVCTACKCQHWVSEWDIILLEQTPWGHIEIEFNDTAGKDPPDDLQVWMEY